MEIKVRKADKKIIAELKMDCWPVWTSPVCEFDWHYDDFETCLFLEGEVAVKAGGREVEIAAGDIAVFPKGLDCRWQVRKAVKKHYNFGPVAEVLR
jgi:hypothetical protein